MPTFSLDDLRSSLERKYAPLVIPFATTRYDAESDEHRVIDRQLTLIPVMRLTRAARTELTNLQGSLSTEDADGKYDEAKVVEPLQRIITLVADNESVAREFLAQVGDDLALLMEVFERYSEGTKAGEASGSPS